MPEIKNNFLQGKMNKDLDERLIPNGQYRDAVNVEVSTAEDSSVGTVKNILGNKRVEDVVPNGYQCVGSISNEKTNKVYWFVSSYSKDAIIEYDVENDIVNHVLVDAYAGTSRAVLMFSGNIITGINIIDDLLFWTDNNSNPKKINIKECIKGTASDDGTLPALDPLSTVHTQLLFEHGSFDGLTIRHTTIAASSAGQWTQLGTTSITPKKGRFFFFQEKQLEKLIPEEVDGVPFEYDKSYFNLGGSSAYQDGVDVPYTIRHYRDGEFLKERRIKVWNDDDSSIYDYGTFGRVDPWVHDPSSGGFITGTPEGDYYPWKDGDVLFGKDITKDIEERHITVIKPNPSKTLSVKINYDLDLNSTSNTPNIFETKFPRFSYRYKYRDGEFSCLAPFTNPVFNPKYTKNLNESVDGNVFYSKDTAYDIKDPYNNAMVNSIHSIELCDFVTIKTPEDVVEIDILYKQEDSPVIYSIGTVKHTDSEWHDWSNNEGTNIGLGKAGNNIGYKAEGGYTKGKYTVTTENIYAALPANQLLRPWDNVPRKALAQEVTGNRIVYGNYLQNYNLGVFKTKVNLSYGSRNNKIGSFDTQGLPSIKSQRNYQLGVVYCDKYGRETPVLTSDNSAVTIPWKEKDGSKNASKTLQLNAKVMYNFPEWVDSLKFFVKETSNEYYNLTMDRAWVTESTYELDNSEGHLWISFPSSDRNKISEEDYIILKKKIGVGEEQVSFENKFKVVDIKNEAPDAIKYELVNLGVDNNSTSNVFTAGADKLFETTNDKRIDKEGCDTVVVYHAAWIARRGHRSSLVKETVLDSSDHSAGGDVIKKNLYMSWRRLDTSGLGVSSKKYKIIGGWKGWNGYVLNLSTPITKIDADIASVGGDSSTTTTHMHPDLIFQIEEKVLKDSEDFSGKFFVKISKNQVTDLIESGNPVNLLDKYQVQAKHATWYWQDDAYESFGIEINTDGSRRANYGLTNWNGYDQNPDYSNNSIQLTANNTVGNVTADNKTLSVTDWYGAWDGILSKHNDNGQFFIDGMHMASGQSDASDYAKYNCITWSGAGSGASDQDDLSAWSYSPLKIWLTDFKNKAEFLDSIDSTNLASGSSASSSAGGTSEEARTNAWFQGNLISTSVECRDNTDWNGLPVDGWVGPLQNVNRLQHIAGAGNITTNHINGLEGFVTTVDTHANGARRWLSGISGNPTEHGVGVDTKVYSDNGEVDRHFMHLSFFAPGKNLHDNNWDGLVAGQVLYGPNSYAANLQGIWGGGHFTGSNPDERFGTASAKEDQHQHLCMESNNTAGSSGSILPEAPGPGIGYGYDTKYRELHERQWDPTFSGNEDPDNKIRDFIRKLHAGSQFKFSTDPNDEVYTIKKVVIKKLYNHTSWRKPYNRYIHGTGTQGVDLGYLHDTSGQNMAYRSVEELGLDYLDRIDANGAYQNSGADEHLDFRNAIVNFGKASNRRVCYIIELDKNPVDSNHNPIADDDEMSGDIVNKDFANIEFLEPVRSVLLSDLSKFPAIWEVDPKKKEVDLDIYYEASDNIPVKITGDTNELFAPIGCAVEVLNANITGASKLMAWDGFIAKLEPGFPRSDGSKEIDYTGMSFKFTREDGSYTIAEAGLQFLTGVLTGKKTTFGFREDIAETIRVGLSWYNCFSFGNGLESNRIRDGFNEMFITNGVKASTTTQETYEEERRAHGLIYSGLYNSNSGINDLNQFIMAEKITKDLNPTYGSIQKLFQRRISLIAFCEDRILSIMSNKDAIYNADGNMQLVATENVLGDVNPFVGDYGISKNPESFASETYRAYFTDKSRGAVLRLSKDGLTPISKAGMHDWFRDNLPKYTSLIGSYDAYKEDYNITLSNSYSENIIYDSFLGYGEESTTLSGITSSRIVNQGPFVGSNFQLIYESLGWFTGTLNIEPYKWGPPKDSLWGSTEVTNHAAIPTGSIQAEVAAVAEVTAVPGSAYIPAIPGSAYIPATPYSPAVPAIPPTPAVPAVTAVAAIPFSHATYSSTLPDSNTGIDGSLHTASYRGGTRELFGGNALPPKDYDGGGPTLYSETRRYHNNPGAGNNGLVTENGTRLVGWPTNISQYPSTVNGAVGRNPFGSSSNSSGSYPVYSFTTAVIKNSISGVITKNTGTAHGASGGILFDRVGPSTSLVNRDHYVEFNKIGIPQSNYTTGELNDAYSAHPNGSSSEHTSIYNGDEIWIQVDLRVFKTLSPGAAYHTSSGFDSTRFRYGYNVIQPQIKLYDGSSSIQNKFVSNWSSAQVSGVPTPWDPEKRIYSTPRSSRTSALGMPIVQGGSGGDAYQSLGGGNSDWRSWADYATTYDYTFPSTSTIWSLVGAGAGSSPGSETITLVVPFKFRDPNQQNSSGDYIGAGDGIEEVKVVNDLRVRVTQIEDPTTTFIHQHPSYSIHPYSTSYSSGNPWLANPLWIIEKVKIVKGFGVTAPHQDAVAEVIGVPGSPYIPGTPYIPAVPYVPATPAVPYTPAVPAVTSIAYVAPVHYVAPVPPADVPAWTEVKHNWLDDYTITVTEASQGGAAITSKHGSGEFGYDYTYVNENGLGQNPVIANPPNQNITYKVPMDWSGLGANAVPGPVGGTPFYHSTNNTLAQVYPGIGYGTTSNVSYNDATVTLNTSGVGANQVIFSSNITGDPFIVGDWYLVDVEYDEAFNPLTGEGYNDPNGSFVINKMGSPSGFANTGWGNVIDPVGVGVYRGYQSTAGIQLVRVLRTEYGSQRNVLRTIFKVPADCWRAVNGHLDNFVLEVYNCTNPVRIEKIITRNLSTLSTSSGSADDWSRWPELSALHQHAFDKPELYWRDSKLCFDANDTTLPLQISPATWSYPWFGWVQNFGTTGNPPAPEATGDWKLNFTVSDLPTSTGTEAFTGSLRGWVLRDASGDTNPPNGGVEGLYFEDINDTGQYKITFTTDGDSNGWTFEHRDTSNDPWVNYSTASYQTASTKFTYLSPSLPDTISFRSNVTSGVLKAAVSNIFLTDETQVFLGGDVGSWNFDGFNPSAENYIHWNMGHERLSFWNAPAIDPAATLAPYKFINVNQWIDNTTPVPRYAKYRIEFDFLISSGNLRIYYFNSEGYGFIAYPSGSSSAAHYNHVFTIGDDEWSPVNTINSAYAPDLKESFVISLFDETQNTTGWIDNISMKRVYDVTTPEKTVSFSEDVNGWTSFKSFIPESGVSVSKKYFTLKDGGLWQHYVPMVYDDINSKLVNEVDDNGTIREITEEEAENYNVFYSDYNYTDAVNIPITARSKIKLVLNNDPSIIKTFNTLNYEGGQAQVIEPLTYSSMTMENIVAHTNEGDIKGWSCQEVKTDMDTGTINEFIKKEGKWFNYIKGKIVNNTSVLDTSLFNVQGIGEVSTAEPYQPV